MGWDHLHILGLGHIVYSEPFIRIGNCVFHTFGTLSGRLGNCVFQSFMLKELCIPNRKFTLLIRLGNCVFHHLLKNCVFHHLSLY